MRLIARASLRQMLTVPYLALVVLAATIIGLLSYRAGSDAVDRLSDHVLSETTSRIAQAIDKHISGSEAVLETAFPPDIPAPISVAAAVDTLRARLWMATSVNRNSNNYVYYGDRKGEFIGVWRHSDKDAELRLLTEPGKPRQIYQYSHMLGTLKDPVTETRLYEPRERPWYKAALKGKGHVWTAIYIDFKTNQLVATRARRVDNAAGEIEGVVATDLFLQHLNDFLRSLKLSTNGSAFIFAADGNLIATSRGAHLRKGKDGEERLNAADSGDPVVAATYKAVEALAARDDGLHGTRTLSFEDAQDNVIQAGYARVRDNAGLDWIVAVAVPRSDFMQTVTENVRRTAWLALFACLLIAMVGYLVLNLIARELRRLAIAARAMGDGVFDSRVPIDRGDEIGELAKAFDHMQKRLLTDRLTGIANREAITRRIEDRIILQRRHSDARPFAVLFVDLNEFKRVNDRFGHDVGDKVLTEIAQRLRAHMRQSDLSARFGGDEFVVLLDNVAHRNDAMAAREKLEHELAMPLTSLKDIDSDMANFIAGATVGMALYPEDGNDLETLLRRADADMYERKKSRESEPR
jgi:diguanylate cyclase (GGDEF)-like protein